MIERNPAYDGPMGVFTDYMPEEREPECTCGPRPSRCPKHGDDK